MITTRLNGERIAPPSVEQLQSWSAARGVLWIACTADRADLDYLSKGLHLHPLVIEDLENRNQRPKVEDYGTYLFSVMFGAVRDSEAQLNLVELHMVLGDGWLATVCDTDVPALSHLHDACEKRPEIGSVTASRLFYRVCDALVDSVFPLLDEVDDKIDRLEDSIVAHPEPQTVSDIFQLKRDLSVLRRVLGPERDLLQLLAGPRVTQLDPDTQLYLRDVYDHAMRIVEQIDAYRDVITSALDVYLSAVSNRLGEQTRRLTVVATIFLPLTFLTGFFGMNFAALVQSISSPRALIAGMGAMLLSVIAVLVVSQRLTARASPLPSAPAPRRLRRLTPRAQRQHNLKTTTPPS